MSNESTDCYIVTFHLKLQFILEFDLNVLVKVLHNKTLNSNVNHYNCDLNDHEKLNNAH